MRRPPLGTSAIVVLATAGLAVALAVRPGDTGRAVEAYALFLGCLGAAVLARLTTRSFPAPTPSRVAAALVRQPRPETRVPELERLERELAMAMESSYDTYYRLRPILRDIAANRLAHGTIALDEPGGRAEELLGPDAWPFVRPDLARPTNHHAAGPTLPEIERAVDALERLGA